MSIYLKKDISWGQVVLQMVTLGLTYYWFDYRLGTIVALIFASVNSGDRKEE